MVVLLSLLSNMLSFDVGMFYKAGIKIGCVFFFFFVNLHC